MRAENAVAGLAGELGELVGAEVALERPANPEHGDYATNVALRLAASQRRPPRELAGELAAQVAGLPQVERAEVAGPGFVNLWLADKWYAAALGSILAAGPGYGGGSEAERRQRVQDRKSVV